MPDDGPGKRRTLAFLTLLLLGGIQAQPARAHAAAFDDGGRVDEGLRPPHLECVPYARQLSGIAIYGNAGTWWEQAEGRFLRGHKPRRGAVLVIAPHANSHLGHVAVVSRIVNRRTIRIHHANWSPIDGRRGQIERDVAVVDVSPVNDWSAVRVWYDPIRDLGSTHWPVLGFIYDKPATEKAAPADADKRRPQGPIRDPIGEIIRRHVAG